MIPWRDAILSLCALPEIGPLVASSTPAWIFARDGSRVVWANRAGGAYLGFRSLKALSEHRWAEPSALRRQVAGLDRALPESGSLAKLRLLSDPRATALACRCRRIRSGDQRGILVAGLDSTDEGRSFASLAAFHSADEVGAVIVDESGRVVAASGANTEDKAAPGERHIEFSDGDRLLRLYLVERQAASVKPRLATAQASEPTAKVRTPERASDAPRKPSAPPREIPLGSDVRAQLAAIAARLGEAKSGDDETRAAPADAAPTPARERFPQPVERPARRRTDNQPEAHGRSIMAGRVQRELSRAPVRFLWQTDAADRFLFVSPGLAQVVGRNAEIVGERWQDVAARLKLDPSQRIARAIAERDTWSGQTAWWPVEGSNVRVPAELTALPVFGGDHSFQGYRGFGVLRPAEALMPAAFEARFGPPATPPRRAAEPVPPYEESVIPANVVPIRADLERLAENARLTPQERSAFEEIAAALRDRVEAPDVFSPASTEPTEAAVPTDDMERIAPPVEDRDDDADAVDATADAPPTNNRPDPSARSAAGLRGVALVSEGEAQRRLREMTAILDTATDGVLILDADGIVKSVNASAEALFGLDATELQGMEFAALLTAESRQSAVDYLSGLKENGVASLLNEGREVEAEAGTGSIPLFITMGRISSDEGGRFCVVLRDITHWKRTESDLVAARQAAEATSGQKSEFLARVSHEIRTPLNAIIGFAEVMIEERFGPVENERYREYLRDIRTSGEHVVSLVNDLLDISKIEAGKLDLAFVAVPLNEVVRECIQLMQPQANRAHVVVRSSLSRDVPGIVADQRTMRQIVLNLLSNSVKFTGPGGQVIASTSLSETGEAVLRVRDTGEGMSEEELARALEPFRQINTSPLADRTGTGLGLPLTKALVEANRASLSIKSARGEGTVVTVTFPPTRVLSE